MSSFILYRYCLNNNILHATTSITLFSGGEPHQNTLEELGIGRPSTYAPILIQSCRNYVENTNKQFVPTELGLCSGRFLDRVLLKNHQYRFHQDSEEELGCYCTAGKDVSKGAHFRSEPSMKYCLKS